MLPQFRVLAFFLAALPLAACDPRFVHGSNLSPREVAELSGVWEGRGSLSFGDQDCPRVYLWTLKVDKGNVEGSLVNDRTPNAPPTRFTTFVDYDGTLRIGVRPDGRETKVSGAFSHDSFGGEARADKCLYVLRLLRRQGAS